MALGFIFILMFIYLSWKINNHKIQVFRAFFSEHLLFLDELISLMEANLFDRVFVVSRSSGHHHICILRLSFLFAFSCLILGLEYWFLLINLWRCLLRRVPFWRQGFLKDILCCRSFLKLFQSLVHTVYLIQQFLFIYSWIQILGWFAY